MTLLLVSKMCNIEEYFGLVKCALLPPRGLLVPVIPATKNGKLYFTLCAACAAEQKKGPCSHTDCQRAIRETLLHAGN